MSAFGGFAAFKKQKIKPKERKLSPGESRISEK
jgi:hypothetical protein